MNIAERLRGLIHIDNPYTPEQKVALEILEQLAISTLLQFSHASLLRNEGDQSAAIIEQRYGPCVSISLLWGLRQLQHAGLPSYHSFGIGVQAFGNDAPINGAVVRMTTPRGWQDLDQYISQLKSSPSKLESLRKNNHIEGFFDEWLPENTLPSLEPKVVASQLRCAKKLASLYPDFRTIRKGRIVWPPHYGEETPSHPYKLLF